jgi:hypothetical protein
MSLFHAIKTGWPKGGNKRYPCVRPPAAPHAKPVKKHHATGHCTNGQSKRGRILLDNKHGRLRQGTGKPPGNTGAVCKCNQP